MRVHGVPKKRGREGSKSVNPKSVNWLIRLWEMGVKRVFTEKLFQLFSLLLPRAFYARRIDSQHIQSVYFILEFGNQQGL